MQDSFSVFESDFGAQRILLYNNYRSSPKLVKIQHVLAQALDKEVVESVSHTDATIIGNECEIWNFPTTGVEAKKLAAFVANEKKTNNLQPRDFVILVRKKAGGYAKTLEQAFRDAGIPLRNEAGMVGSVPLQNLLAEELSELLVMVLRIAMTPRAGYCWSKFQNALSALRGVSLDNEKMHAAVARELDKFSIDLHANHATPPSTKCTAHALVGHILDFIGRGLLIAAHPAYAQGDWFEKVTEAAAEHLHASSSDAANWIEAIDAYEGLHAIPLMTIHKSKSLEYHTVIFVGLDDGAWNTFPKNEIDDFACFLVAFSRAKQRVILTYCASRGAQTEIDHLYNLLRQASVNVIDKS